MMTSLILITKTNRSEDEMADAHALLDFLIKEYGLKNDAALSKSLGVSPPAISKIRSRMMGVSGDMKILIYKKTGMSIEDIESFLEKT
jgi:plasmid maintenance system antidote protein VapI